ncbi:hypothetical protein DID78_06875 [Candidatus Marinamargulisbacteria bacterium SCGC AG-343-D04]|nr:hypothetical protein DID78_06875 [Candidatus Marinamargulisbacteria bacterium SCGC AG-343-D04]
MSNVAELKKAVENISSKKHVVSTESVHARDVSIKHNQQEREDALVILEKHEKLMKEFNVSISLLMRVFKGSKFDQVMGLAMDPVRLVLLNFVIGVFRGLGFFLAAITLFYLFFSVFHESIIPLFF